MNSASHSLFRSVFTVGLILCSLPNFINTEDTCSWMPDGTKVCNDEGLEEDHNVWTTEPLDQYHADNVLSEEDSEKFKTLALSYHMDEIEQELFVLFAGFLKDWNPEDGLKKMYPEIIVLAILNSFSVFDLNDDGSLEYAEMESVLLKRESQENLSQIMGIFDEYPENKISIFACLKMFKKFNSGIETGPLIAPFERLDHLPPASAKKIIQGSVKMFIDSDENNDGQLSRDEFYFGMQQAQQKRKEMGVAAADITSDQLEALLALMDKDQNEHLTFTEFQATIPEKPKSFEESMDAAFKEADVNSDGKLSENEFLSYMKRRSQEMSKELPSDKEVLDVFEKLDANHDNALSSDEMMGMFDDVKKAQEKRIIEAFQSFDANADGSLSLDELEYIVKGMEQNSGQKIDVKVFLTMLDQNMDKKVSLEEMQGVLTQLIK